MTCTQSSAWLLALSLSLWLSHTAEADQQLKPSEEKSHPVRYEEEYVTDCSKLLPGQFLCLDLNIDPATQQPAGCDHSTRTANVTCRAAPGILCRETGNGTFTGTVPCKPTSGHHHQTALLLSVFLGMFGLDRFYLGYPAIGLAKLVTLGGMFAGQLVDIVLIASHTLTPADGSAYVTPYYGANLHVVTTSNQTYRLPQPDWHIGEL